MKYADRVQVVTTTTGTGSYALGSATVGCQTFADVADMVDGDVVYYNCTDNTDWEVGLGTLSGSKATLTRTQILDSSNNGAAISWSAGDKNLMNTIPARIIDFLDQLNHANGFDLGDVNSQGTLTWDNTNRQISLAVKSGETEFSYWVDGAKYQKTSTIVSAAIPTGASGTYYFYLNENGVLGVVSESTAAVTRDVFYSYAIVALVYWNDADSIGTPFEERHGHRMDSADHEMEHRTIGARYASGFALTGLVDAQDTFTGVLSGVFYDEDICHELSAATTLPFLYRLGTGDGRWVWSTADNKVGFANGGTYATWNEWDGTNWGLTEANASHDFILHFVVANKTLVGYHDFAKIIDQAGYSSKANARAAIEGAKKKLITDGLPSPEMCFLGAYICKRDATYGGVLEDLSDGSTYLDLRGSSSRGTGGDSAVSNKAADITIADAGSLITATNVELALQEHRLLIDLNDIDEVTSDPSSPATGKKWINITDDKLKIKVAAGIYAFEATTYTAD